MQNMRNKSNAKTKYKTTQSTRNALLQIHSEYFGTATDTRDIDRA